MGKRRTPRAAILKQIPAARARARRERSLGRRATAAYYDRASRRVMLELTNGNVFGFPSASIPALTKVSPDRLAQVEVSPGGGGLHWEYLDVDLSVPGLLL